jgi:hypothetical protein
MIEQADLVLAMTPRHVDALHRLSAARFTCLARRPPIHTASRIFHFVTFDAVVTASPDP